MAADFAKGGVADVADGVFVYVGPDGDSNNGIVLTDEGTISIDSYVKQYAGLMRALEQVSDRPVRFAINTHDDADHYSMNHFFRREGAMIIASEVCRSRIEAKMGWRRGWRICAGVTPRSPTSLQVPKNSSRMSA
ncbi:MAG TPA: hypothetical protein VJ834_10710 [Burkholderiales bacterium]|nr:hypothetical protein [Burkholderiales bacterium]